MLDGVTVAVGVKVFDHAGFGVLLGVGGGPDATKLITLCAGSVYVKLPPDTATFASCARFCDDDVI
jgi:hypothetical protein